MPHIDAASSLCGQRYLVTGATSGIGWAVAEALRAAEADVVAFGRNPVMLSELSLRGCETHSRELTDSEALERAIAAAGPFETRWSIIRSGRRVS